jgi:hypothetical protein
MNAEQRREAALAAAPLKRHQAQTYSPNIGAPFSGGDNRSISQFMKDIDASYRT